MNLFFDCESTGKADLRGHPTGAQQPRIVQLAALLMDDDAKEVMSMNVIIRPEGYKIPAEAAAIHGITTEFAESVGVALKNALSLFSSMKRASEVYVAHNVDFDRFLVMGEVMRTWPDIWTPETMPESKCFCTMKAMTDICQLPGPYGFKWPKLIEAHQHAFGCGFDGAHDALADVRAAAKIYFWLKNGKPEPEPTTPDGMTVDERETNHERSH